MRRFCSVLEHVVGAVAAAMLAAFAAIIIVDVACRYWLHIPLAWVPELTVFLFQWMAFLGASLAARRGLHFGLGLLLPKIWPNSARAMGILVAIVVVMSSVLLLLFSTRMIEQAWHSNYPTLPFTHAMIYVGVAISATLMALFGLEQLIDLTRSLRKRVAA
ncbi:MAG: TRAP transporter small permease subunit [Betaproteobacteria bacterium]|nr:TRAP transporter small permease subunit [Betaproteobacteria bacterium]